MKNVHTIATIQFDFFKILYYREKLKFPKIFKNKIEKNKKFNNYFFYFYIYLQINPN